MITIQYVPLMYGTIEIELSLLFIMHLCICIGVFHLRSTNKTADAITVVWDPADSLYCGPVLYYIVTIRNLAIP